MKSFSSGLPTLILSIVVPATVPLPVAGQSPTSAELSITPQRTGFHMASDAAEGWEDIWGLAAGAGVMWRLSDHIGLRLSLDYSPFGANQIAAGDGNVSRVRARHVLAATLVEASVPVGPEIELTLSFGPSVLLASNCRYWSREQELYSSLPGGTWSSCDDSRRQPPGLSPSVPFISPRHAQKGVVVRLEARTPVSESLRLTAGVRGDWALEAVDRLDEPGDWRRRAIGASAGLSLSLGG